VKASGEGERWRWLGRALAFGGVYDAAFAIAILLFTAPAAAALRIELPDDRFYLHLVGLLLLILAGVYAVAAREPRRYHLVGPVSSAGRAAGCALFVQAWRDGRPATFLVLGLADLLIAGWTALAWRRARRADRA